MAFDPNKKFLYFNLDTTIGEMDSSLCFPVSSFVGAETQTSAAIHLHFKGSKGTDSTIVRVSHDQVGLIKTFYQNLVNEINFGEKAFIKVHDYGQRGVTPSDVSFRMKSFTAPIFTLQDTDFIVGGDSLTFDSVQLTGIQTSSESFVDNDISLMTSAAIDDRINTAVAASSGVSVSDSTANTDFPVVFHDESNNLHDDTAAFEYNPSTGNLTVSKITGCEIDTDGETITLNGGEITDVLSYTGADITVSGTIKSTGSTNDYSQWSTSTNGATTFTTVDAAGADAHFEINADGNITLDAAGDIALEAAGGDVTGDADNYTFTSATSAKPVLTLSNSNTDAVSSEIVFEKTATGADNDDVGKIDFKGDNDNNEVTSFATILAEIADASDSDEAGRLSMTVMASDGSFNHSLPAHQGRNAFTATGHGTNDIVDVSLGYGAASTTTVAGTLTMGSTAAMTNAGQLSVAAQPNITTMTGFLGGTANALITDDGDGTVTSESELTYNAGILQIESATSQRPSLRLTNTNTDAEGVEFSFKKTATGADNDVIGSTYYIADNDADEVITYAKTTAAIKDASDSDEAGNFTIQVATSNGTASSLRNVLYAEGSPSTDDVDVTIGHGSTSTTTIGGNLNVNGTDHAFTSSTDSKPHVTLSCGGSAQVGAQLTFKRTATGGNGQNLGDIYFIGNNDADEEITYAQINGDIQDASDGAEEGEMTLSVASHDGELQPGLIIVSGNIEDEVDATIGNGANSSVTVPGKLSIGTRIDFDGVGITAIQAAAESFADNDTSLMTSAAIDDRINAAGGSSVTADPFSTTVIKILPHQFMPNDDVGRPIMIEDDTSNILGVRAVHSTDEMYAFQKIPTGYKVTHVQVHASASTSSAVTVRSFNYQTGADNAVSSTSGDLNANINVTDIPASATQDLVIKVAPASAATIMYGATVTIATI